MVIPSLTYSHSLEYLGYVQRPNISNYMRVLYTGNERCKSDNEINRSKKNEM